MDQAPYLQLLTLLSGFCGALGALLLFCGTPALTFPRETEMGWERRARHRRALQRVGIALILIAFLLHGASAFAPLNI